MTEEQILNIVCKSFEVTKKQLQSKSRKSKVVLARMEYCYLLKKIKGYSVAKIVERTNIQERMVFYYLSLLLSEVKYNPKFIDKHEVLKSKIKSLYGEEV